MKTDKSKLGGWIILIIGLVMAIRTGTNVYRLWRAGDQVEEQTKAVEAARLENERLKQELAKAQNPETVEKEAREKLGYGREGETIVIVPKEENPGTNKANEANSQKTEPNWKKWWKLYIRI